jgi:hypothetical protein
MASVTLQPPTAKIDFLDRTLIVATVILAVLFTWGSLSRPPLEDAAILLRYVRNVAAGYGIVWNPGEKPVDGSTDFLFLLVASGLVKLGWQPQAAARLWDLVAHCLTIVLIYVFIRKQRESTRWAALLSAAYLAVGPALLYIWDGFGTPVFALFASLTWWLAWRIKENGNSHLNCALFGLCGLATALERPEGVFLAGLMLLALIFLRGPRHCKLVTLYFLAIMGIGGGFYFFWHWYYFGYPLPNPFYVRGNGHLFRDSLRESLINIRDLSGPFALFYVAALCSRRTAKLAVFSLIPIVGFGSLWLLLSNEMNHYMRYQYVILPLVLLSWYPLWNEIREEFGLPNWEGLKKKSSAVSLGILATLGFFFLIHRGRFWSNEGKHSWDSAYDIGLMLGEFKDKHYTLATSEAGLMAYYSEWRTIDTWGLNDTWIAHHGTISQATLEREKPDVIFFACAFSPIVRPTPTPNWEFSKPWFAMVMSLKNYADSKGYRLAGAYGRDPHSTQYIYVRKDFPDSAKITQGFQQLMEKWNKRDEAIMNFAALANQGSP